MEFLAQVNNQESFWKHANGTGTLWMWIILGLVIGAGLMFGLTQLPSQARKPIVATIIFLCGLFYVLLYFWPAPVARDPGTLPTDFVDKVGFWLEDAQQPIGQ